MGIGLAAVGAFLALAVGPAQARAASPVLEFASSTSFPIDFEAEGGEVSAALTGFGSVVHCAGSEGSGEITGPRSAISSYRFTDCEATGGDANGAECTTPGADAGEIRSETLAAELVFLDQAKHEVGMLLNPPGGVYISFECGEELVEGSGPFLSPVGPINQMTTSFTAALNRAGATQAPNEYENAFGEKRKAIPMGRTDSDPWGTTGVELDFAIETSVPLEIKAVTAAEIEAQQREEQALAADRKRQEEQAARAAAERKHQEEEAARIAAERQREEAHRAKLERLQRQLRLSNGLLRCRKTGAKKKQRARCEKRVKRKFDGRLASKR